MSDAVGSIGELRILLEHFIQFNTALFNRILALEAQPQVSTEPSTTSASMRSSASHRFTFEMLLFDSRPYKRTLRNPSQSITGSRVASVNWSVLSGLSLSQVSNISVFHFATCPAELSNPECYIIASDSPIMDSGVKLETVKAVAHNTASPALMGTVKALLQSAIDTDRWDSDTFTPLHFACATGIHETILELLTVGEAIEAKNFRGWTPLCFAARYGHQETVQVLLKAGAEIQVKDRASKTPLHLAARGGHSHSVKVLLEWGADKEKDGFGNSSLHFAAEYGHHETVRVLFESGADMDAKGMFGYTPWHLAARGKYPQTVRLLLESGANIEATTDTLRTPLHMAAAGGADESFHILLDLGGNKDAKDVQNRTPLYSAVVNRRPNIVRFLLNGGADKEAKGHDNRHH